VTDWPVGVTVNHAVGFREIIPECGFNIVAKPGSVGESDGKIIKLKDAFFRQGGRG